MFVMSMFDLVLSILATVSELFRYASMLTIILASKATPRYVSVIIQWVVKQVVLPIVFRNSVERLCSEVGDKDPTRNAIHQQTEQK